MDPNCLVEVELDDSVEQPRKTKVEMVVGGTGATITCTCGGNETEFELNAGARVSFPRTVAEKLRRHPDSAEGELSGGVTCGMGLKKGHPIFSAPRGRWVPPALPEEKMAYARRADQRKAMQSHAALQLKNKAQNKARVTSGGVRKKKLLEFPPQLSIPSASFEEFVDRRCETTGGGY